MASLSFNDATANIATGTTLTQTVSSLSIASGQYIFIRFIHPGGSSSDNLGWDDITITPVLGALTSANSDIAATSGFTYPANIAYNLYQGTSPLTTGNSIEVAQFDIRDGGATLSDPDALSTILTAITFNVANSSSIRRIALFDGTSNLAEVAGGSTAAFSGLTLTAPDNSSKTFSVRVSFTAAVTDNQQFSLTVNSATASASGSGFAAANAGGAATSTSGDNNRIEVTATNLVFNVTPSTVSLNAVMNPSPTIDAIDGLLNKDLDFTASVGLSTTGTFGGTATTSVTAVSGTATFSNLLFSVAGTGITIAGSAAGVSPTGDSPAFDVTNPLPEINLKQSTTTILSGGSYDYGSLVSGNASSPITFTIENLGSAILNLTGTPIIAISGTNASEFTIDQTATTATVAAAGTTTFIVTYNPVSTGSKTAQISIANNDATGGENPYLLNLTGAATASALSDIANTSGYSNSSNIAYAGYQASSTLTTGTSAGVTGLTIRDGAGTSDGDNLGTTLTAISFSTGGSTAIRTAALFDGTTNVAEVAVNGATTIPFTGLSLSAADNATKDFELRVTFQGTVTDNQQITFTVTSATASAAGSGFATANAGGAASAVTGDINRIEVTATQLLFVQQPTNTVAGAVMFPPVTVKGIDALGNTDLDFTANVDITSSGSLNSSPQTAAGVAGIATFNAITHTATGTGFMLTASSTGFTGILSNAFNITVQTAGTLIFEDNFNYNTILTSNGYTASSGTGTNNLTAGATGLAYTDYGSTGIGYALAVANTGQDVYKTFTLQSSPGSIYASFLVNISASLTGDYVFAFAPSGSNTTYRARLFIKASTNAGYVKFGIANAATGTTYGTNDFAQNATHLVVVKYQFISGVSATATVFVDPNMVTEPASGEISVIDAAAANAPADISSFTIRQGSNSSAPTFVMDGLRIATSWGSLLGNPQYDASSAIAGGNYNTVSVVGSSELTVNGTVIAHKTLTTDASSTLTIPATNVLNLSASCQATVSGTLNNVAGTAGLVVNSDATGTGSLILNTAGVAATIQRFISHWTDDNHGWHLLSSPVSSQAVQPEFVPLTPGSAQDFYAWDEVNGWWFNSKDPTLQWVTGFDASFGAGKGYLVAYLTDMTKNFTGTALNVSNVSKTGLTYTSPGNYSGTSIDPGWNLLGNPFSSAITWNTAGWALSNLATTAKVWNESNASYADLDVAGMIIPPHQGFMVQVLDASGGSLTIPAAARVHSTQSWYKSADIPLIRLMAHNISAQTAQESTVIFDSQAKPGFDPSTDSRFFPGYAPLFYSVEGTENLSTNVLPGIDAQAAIPFNFVKTAGTAYSIEAVKIENISSTVYLTDLKLDKTQNLNENPLYTFTSGSGDNPARFVLTFSQTGIGETTTGGREIYTYGNNLYVANPGISRLEVFNLTGQLLLNEQINSTGLYKTSLRLPTGYYMVRLTTATGVFITKVFIQS